MHPGFATPLQHTATRHNTLQHAATPCNTLLSFETVFIIIKNKNLCAVLISDFQVQANTCFRNTCLMYNMYIYIYIYLPYMYTIVSAVPPTCIKLHRSYTYIQFFLFIHMYKCIRHIHCCLASWLCDATATPCNTLQHVAALCNTLQHTTTLCAPAFPVVSPRTLKMAFAELAASEWKSAVDCPCCSH